MIMNMLKPHTILLLSVSLLVISCRSHSTEPAEMIDFDTESSCLNGTMIVSSNGKYGLADTCGRVILPVGYDEIYFLTDDLAVAFNGDLCCFFDKGGQRLGESIAGQDSSPEELMEIYSGIEKTRREQWDTILNRYEDFRKYCLSDSATAATASMMAEDIKDAVQKIGGPMEKDQKARFESEYSSYRQ